MDEAPHTPASAFGLKGRRALVTGGSSGIGRATSELLRDLGCDVHVLDLDPFSAPPGTTGHECDLAVTASVNAAVDAAAGDRGIHVLVNCAAIGAFGDISTSSDEEWARVLNVNVIGLARVFRAALPHLRVAGDAGVVVLGSIAAWLGVPRRAVYSASKGGDSLQFH